jgi:crotonobetainyl-CoA:carnitine CoA-transferase CaiB-like acyl-CoA transferase
MGQPLDGITIFDMTHAAVGPWATMMMAGLGANVIKVEIPTGDLQQRIPPRQNGFGTIYAHCNLGKRSIVLDLKNEVDLAKAYRILSHADVFIENMRPGVAARLGFDYKTVAGITPSIIYVDSSAWGPRGPMGRSTGADGPVQAFSGFTSLNGAPGASGEYLRAFGYIDVNASQAVALSLLEALLRRARTGAGQYVETTMLGASMLLQSTRIAEYLASGSASPRLGSASAIIVPDQAFLCLDKAYLAVSAVTEAQWQALCDAVGAADLAADARFSTNAGRVEHRDELIPALESIFESKPRRWWQIRLAEAGVPHARAMGLEQLRHHPQVRDNRFLQSLDVPHAGMMTFADYPWRFSEAPLELRPPPYTGRDTEEILAEYQEEAPQSGGAPVINGVEKIAGTLDGITVVDATQGLCGPMAGMLLAGMGARVVKIEPPGADYARGYGPPFLDGDEGAAHFFFNRNKESLTLDFETDEGRERLRDLVKDADVLLEDLGPGPTEWLGVDHPRLIHCSITPFGEAGPLADRPASDLVIQAMTDCFSALGTLGAPPVRLGADVASMNAGMHAAQGVLAALIHRRETGKGQRVSVSLFGSTLHMRGILWTAQTNPDEWTGHPVEHATSPINTGYATRDLPVFFGLGRGNEERFPDLLKELGMEACIDDPRFANGGDLATGTRVHAHKVKPLWERAFAGMTSQEVIDLIVRYGGEAERLNDYPALFAHPQVEAVGITTEVEHPKAGRLKWIKLPWEIEGGPHID